MRRNTVWVVSAVTAVLLFAACSSSGSKSSPTSSAPPTSAPVTTSAPSTTDAPVTAQSTSTTATPTTVSNGCPPSAGSTAPFGSPSAATSASVLRTVKVSGQRCGDLVVFGFRPDNGAPPICTVGYKTGPFTQDASGKPVLITGTAFLAVRCEPARSYDPETGVTTYKAPARIETTGAHHVVGMASTGDFEGVMSWVIGLDGQRPFHAAATAGGALVISIF